MRSFVRSFAVLLALGVVGCGKRALDDRDGAAGGAPMGTGGSAGSNAGAGAVGAAGARGSAGSNGGNGVAGSTGGAVAGSTGGAVAGTGGASAGTGGAVAGTGGAATAGTGGAATAGTGGGATSGTGPLRLLIFYTRWGTSYPEWWPTGSDRSFTMSTMMQALEPYKDELIVVSGLTNANLASAQLVAANASETGDGMFTLLTARPAGQGGPATGPSLDTVVGDCGGAAGPPLRLAVGQYGFNDSPGVSFADDGSPIRGEHDPHAVAMRVLGHDVTAPDPTGDINAIYPAIGTAHMAVAVEALATAKTCAVTLMWGDHFNPAVLGITGSDLHELSHDTIGLFESVNGGTPRPDNRFAKMQRWYAQQFASLLDRLRATPLGSGTLLDQSVVVWISESGTGVDHQGFYIPVVIAGGGGGGRLDVGQFLEIRPHQRSDGGFVETTTIERTQGDLLQALANLWGMPSFGDVRIARQTLKEILKP